MSSEPAFPHMKCEGHRDYAGGMSLRDYFAAQALPSVISNCVPMECQEGENMEQMFARKAYRVADAMLATRSVSSPERP
jgi:hypothetical protein